MRGFCFILMLLLSLKLSAGDYKIGVFYFPGWKNNELGAPAAYPWDAIKKYPERQPLLGWYQEGKVSVAETQIDWMAKYGVDYVVYDWYWSDSTVPFLEHGVKTFLKAKNRSKVEFAFLWANHDKAPNSIYNFAQMIRYLCRNYFNQSNYYKIDNKPVFFIFSQQSLLDKAKALGKTQNDLLTMAREIAQEEGFSGLYIVGGAEAVEYWVKDQGPKAGYDAYSAYNYHRGFSGLYIPDKPNSHSYRELDDAYRESWDWIVKNSNVPYIVPVTSGWSKTPWGGSKDKLHDNCMSTPEEFAEHLKSAKALIDKYPDKTKKSLVVCCWNEYGEGSIVEPTKKYGFQFLEQISAVFQK